MDRHLSLSVVIPAKNEERTLPKLLGALRGQTRPPREVIVADAGSTDRTREIAAAFGCTVVPGGLPAAGRNAGARAATGDYVVFLDSDVFIEPEFLEALELQARVRRLRSGTVYNIPRYIAGDKGYHRVAIRLFDRFVYFLHNVGLELSSLVRYPYATGTCMFLSRALFERIGGFNERIVAFEDSELVARAAKIARHGVIKRPVVYISTRRFDKHDRLLWVVYLVINGVIGRVVGGEKSHGDYFDKKLTSKLPIRPKPIA
jgi:glycosyltransferase involved in cell wall biosynthesis